MLDCLKLDYSTEVIAFKKIQQHKLISQLLSGFQLLIKVSFQ